MPSEAHQYSGESYPSKIWSCELVKLFQVLYTLPNTRIKISLNFLALCHVLYRTPELYSAEHWGAVSEQQSRNLCQPSQIVSYTFMAGCLLFLFGSFHHFMSEVYVDWCLIVFPSRNKFLPSVTTIPIPRFREIR